MFSFNDHGFTIATEINKCRCVGVLFESGKSIRLLGEQKLFSVFSQFNFTTRSDLDTLDEDLLSRASPHFGPLDDDDDAEGPRSLVGRVVGRVLAFEKKDFLFFSILFSPVIANTHTVSQSLTGLAHPDKSACECVCVCVRCRFTFS